MAGGGHERADCPLPLVVVGLGPLGAGGEGLDLRRFVHVLDHPDVLGRHLAGVLDQHADGERLVAEGLLRGRLADLHPRGVDPGRHLLAVLEPHIGEVLQLGGARLRPEHQRDLFRLAAGECAERPDDLFRVGLTRGRLGPDELGAVGDRVADGHLVGVGLRNILDGDEVLDLVVRRGVGRHPDLDLENRLKLKDRKPLIVALRYQFDGTLAAYERANLLYKKIQDTYPGQKELLLRSDDQLVSDLTRLARAYDSCHLIFNDYKSTSNSLGKTGYNQDLDPVEIQDFKTDGTTVVDFYRDDLRVWDYKRWALATEETILKEITPLREQFSALAAEINNVHQKLKKDSVSIRADIASLKSKNNFPALKKIDPQPMPAKLFEMKISELVYGNQVVEDKALKDSSSSIVLKALNKELGLARKIDSLASLVAEVNLEEAGENYKQFVTSAYGTVAVLKTEINSTKEYGIREVVKKENEIKRKSESLKWIVSAPDSIPMFKEVPARSRFRPLIIEEGKFTSGLKFGADSVASGYAVFVNSTQMAESRADFPVDQVFKKRNLPFTKTLITNEKDQVYFVMFYSEAKVKDAFPATLAKVQRGQPLAWSVNYLFQQPPVELIYSPETADLAVRTKSSTGEVFGIVFDKNGKVVK